MEKNESFYFLLSTLLKVDTDEMGFCNNLSGILKYQFIISEKESTYTLYLQRRNSIQREDEQLSQFDAVLENLSIYDGEEIIIHVIQFHKESYLIFTGTDLNKYLGYIVVRNNI